MWRLARLLPAVGVIACGPKVADYCAQGTPECTPAPDASTNVTPMRDSGAPADQGLGDTGSSPRPDGAMCDPSKGPHDAPCVVDWAYGVFVSPSGSDSSPGTRTLPLQTIGRGLDSAKSSGKRRVYVCAGTYAEKLVVNASRDGLAIFGGLDCGTWNYGPNGAVRVAPTQSGYALDIEALEGGVTVEDVTLIAQNANGSNAGESSVAVFVNGSANVALHRVTMIAGNGSDGAATPSAASADSGASVVLSNWIGTPPRYPELNGNDAMSTGGGAQKVCRCLDGTTSTGGQGGGTTDAGVQTPGPGSPSYGVAGAGSAGTNGAFCGSGATPSHGVDAPKESTDVPNTSWGAVTVSGWAPSVGTGGSNGQPGQGGGGGGDGPAGTGAGGSGACGGCGGLGGKPGSGGGSSIALLSYKSSVALVGCTMIAHDGGHGGAGGNGESGQAGSLIGGNGAQSGCAGGAGGSGAAGSGGQGGPGGLSLGIAFTGTAPTSDGVFVASTQSLGGVVVGTPGAGGARGLAGAAAASAVGQPQPGMDGAPGTTGIAQGVFAF